MFNAISCAIKAFFKVFREPKLIDRLQVEQKKDSKKDISHLTLLRQLQQEGRLIDFFKEEIEGFTNEQIGAAIRQVHRDCSKQLEELLSIRPIMHEAKEGEKVEVPENYDAQQIKLTGKVPRSGPFSGVLKHKGWRAAKLSLPQCKHAEVDVIAPAEVEIS
ncbi:MAG: DUF2760 domain-containing protein [Chlamydiales bacterium]|nr:DUF2760 domain-containing protein [Chlamydiales bacterium]NCF71093.1 DUF2760 domain-containing protein [Chlamydiales bacterium]